LPSNAIPKTNSEGRFLRAREDAGKRFSECRNDGYLDIYRGVLQSVSSDPAEGTNIQQLRDDIGKLHELMSSGVEAPALQGE